MKLDFIGCEFYLTFFWDLNINYLILEAFYEIYFIVISLIPTLITIQKIDQSQLVLYFQRLIFLFTVENNIINSKF